VAPEASRRFALVHSGPCRETAEYYRDGLDFSFNRYWGEPPCFVILGRDSAEIFLSSPGVQGVARPNRKAHPEVVWDAYVCVTDVEALRNELTGRGAKVIRGPSQLSITRARSKGGLQWGCPLLQRKRSPIAAAANH
jgi:hypothetical protein